MHETIVKWNQSYIKGTTLSTSTKLTLLLFAHDHTVKPDSEDHLQIEVFILLTKQKFWKGNITEKSETMAFFAQDPVRCKIVVDNQCLQQVKNFKYLGCAFPMK